MSVGERCYCRSLLLPVLALWHSGVALNLRQSAIRTQRPVRRSELRGLPRPVISAAAFVSLHDGLGMLRHIAGDRRPVYGNECCFGKLVFMTEFNHFIGPNAIVTDRIQRHKYAALCTLFYIILLWWHYLGGITKSSTKKGLYYQNSYTRTRLPRWH